MRPSFMVDVLLIGHNCFDIRAFASAPRNLSNNVEALILFDVLPNLKGLGFLNAMTAELTAEESHLNGPTPWRATTG